MKEETKKQAPAYGAIALAAITAITTSFQYCQTAEETKQLEIKRARSDEAIIDGLSGEISKLQHDVNSLYMKAERLQAFSEVCMMNMGGMKSSYSDSYPSNEKSGDSVDSLSLGIGSIPLHDPVLDRPALLNIEQLSKPKSPDAIKDNIRQEIIKNSPSK